MAIVLTNEFGWVISHELFMQKLYKETQYLNISKSYSLNSKLFGIQIPFVKQKKIKNLNEKLPNDVEIVKRAYDNLNKLFIMKCDNINFKIKNNYDARIMANNFYDTIMQHSFHKFLGGNTTDKPLIFKLENELYLVPPKSLFYCHDIKHVFNHLNNKKYDLILMDPPWWNKFIRRKRKKNFKFGYNMMYNKDLSSIPINNLLEENGIIGIWCTSAPSHIKAILTELFPAWNVEFIAQWFWLKITKYGEPICDFSNSLGKQPFERVIFGKKLNFDRKIPQPEKDKVFMSIPSAIHSHKPPLCDLLQPYLPKNPECLELFARYLLPSWTSYGNEVLKLQHISLFTDCNLLDDG